MAGGRSGAAQRRAKANVGATGIIATAERLFAEQGINAVSLRQVAAASGLANHYSVQYHFSDRKGLLRAIFEERLPVIDRRRQELFDQLTAEQRNELAALFDCTHRPLLEAALDAHKSNFARLLIQVIRDPEYRELRNTYAELTPCGYEIAARMRRLLPQVAPELRNLRLTVATGILLDAIADPTMYGFLGEDGEAADPGRAYEVALVAALGSLQAPG